MSFSKNKTTEKILADQNVKIATQLPLFDLPTIDNKRVEISFSGHDISSDGGLLLVKEVEHPIGIIKALTSCMIDNRNKG